MKKRIISIIAAFAMIFTLTVPCFAEDNEYEAEELADLVEEYTDEDEISDDYSDEDGDYLFEDEDCDITVPEDGDDSIEFDSDEDDIDIGLPEDVEDVEGEITENGTVVYNPDEEDIAVEVQVLEEEEDEVEFNSVKQMITIEGAEAPREYSFEYGLEDGYRLVKSEEYYTDGENPYPGWVFVVNENSRIMTEEEVVELEDEEDGLEDTDVELPGVAEIVMYIEPAWAKDANGEDVDTWYDISGNTLKQYVEFNEGSAFPIIADPTGKKPKSRWLYDSTDTYSVTSDYIELFLGGSSVKDLIKKYAKHKKAVEDAKTDAELKEAKKLLANDKKKADKAVRKAAKKVAKKSVSAVYSGGISLAINGASLFVTGYMLKRGYTGVNVTLKHGLYRTYLKQGPHSGWEPWDYYKVVYKGKKWKK